MLSNLNFIFLSKFNICYKEQVNLRLYSAGNQLRIYLVDLHFSLMIDLNFFCSIVNNLLLNKCQRRQILSDVFN